MINFIYKFTCFALLIAFLYTVPTAAKAQAFSVGDAFGIERTIRFERGENSATFSGRVKNGTAHWYKVKGLAGQQMTVVLKTGDKTSFTVFGRQAGILENADGVRQTQVILPHSGEYLIEVGTDATANYTLEVSIK